MIPEGKALFIVSPELNIISDPRYKQGFYKLENSTYKWWEDRFFKNLKWSTMASAYAFS